MVSQTTDRFNGYVASLAVKVPCVVATDVNITLYGTQTINGVAVGTGDRVLVVAQTDLVENGIWLVTSSEWNRAPDFDGRRDATTDSLVLAARSAGAPLLYKVDTVTPFIIGEDEIEFSVYIDPDTAGGAPPTHTGEVTGDTDLTLDVSAITNRTDVVADSADDAVIHDDTDGSIKKVNLSSITDAGYF
jgi:hypothetical protein